MSSDDHVREVFSLIGIETHNPSVEIFSNTDISEGVLNLSIFSTLFSSSLPISDSN